MSNDSIDIGVDDGVCQASLESKTWPASDKAKQLVKETVVIGFLATPKGCYRNISEEDALRATKSGGYVSPTFTEWMMDGIWPEDITPQQAADMIDYYVKLVGVDHVGMASDDMCSIENVVKFAKTNPSAYNDDGYMMNAFDQGATDCGMLARILPAITDELWKRLALLPNCRR